MVTGTAAATNHYTDSEALDCGFDLLALIEVLDDLPTTAEERELGRLARQRVEDLLLSLLDAHCPEMPALDRQERPDPIYMAIRGYVEPHS